MSSQKNDASKIALVIPCFNDSMLLLKLLETIPFNLKKVIVDDGSKNKISLLESDLSRFGNIFLIEHPVNLGQGAAIETGFEFIRQNYSQLGCQYVATFDSDGQHKIEDVLRMVRLMSEESLDVVLGSRFLERIRMRDFAGGKLKFVILKVSALISRFTLKMKLTDRHNGLRLFSLSSILKLSLTQSGYGHADEILREIRRLNLKFSEIQVDILYPRFETIRGQSLLNSFNIVYKRFFGER